ncbi:MAG TPA: SDR family NAD(P)-dependent oxidoreductase [Thermoanaerobaculia bacterium]|nr:SDR family NAD(P)-dependent oxidoreductase [Thermoanaerobaculia bacterium]
MNELVGRVAIVTGGDGAIGGAIIERLRSGGTNALSLDTKDGAGIHCDVTDDTSVSQAVGRIESESGRLDVAVHAAGISRDAVVWKLGVDEWDRIQAVNLRGAFLLIRHSVPLMRKSGGGRIILIGSINGSRGKYGTSAYSASKSGLLGLSRTVSREVGRFGITVNVVEPGWVRTPLTEALDDRWRDEAVAETQLGELVEPSDIAAMVAFLSGPDGRRITGQILRVDAGQCIG